MSIKYTIQGGLIYLTLLFFAATAIAMFCGSKKQEKDSLHPELFGTAFWVAGFIIALISAIWRGIHTGHPPMQNLFEFFLCMTAVLAPLSFWNWRRHGINTIKQDALLGIIILIPAGFVFNEEVRMLPPALQSPLFVPHVAAYVAGYVMMARAALMALPLFKKSLPRDRLVTTEHAVRQSVCVGFLLITLGLVLGSIWGKICWGHYWQWDPKETWSLATWLVYIAYFHAAYWKGIHAPRLQASLIWLGLVFIVLTLTWINLSRFFQGMHTYA